MHDGRSCIHIHVYAEDIGAELNRLGFDSWMKEHTDFSKCFLMETAQRHASERGLEVAHTDGLSGGYAWRPEGELLPHGTQVKLKVR